MSWGTCYSSCNNICSNYPTLMSDGRIYTDYNPSCERNNEIIRENGINTPMQYRSYLVNNARDIMRDNKQQACKEVGVCNFSSGNEVNHNKYLYSSCQDRTQPFGYQTSDLKNLYLTRQDLQTRMSAPLLSQQQYLSYPNAN